MQIQARSQTFVGGGRGQSGQILGPFIIMRGLSCDRVGFGHFFLTPPPQPTVKMLVLGGERLTPNVLDHYLQHNLVMATWGFEI